MIAKAPWGGRWFHTSVVDAAGAIYVIGGSSGSFTTFNDVWVSTDGGARPDCASGWSWRVRQGGNTGVLQGTMVQHGGTAGVLGSMRGY